MMIKSLRISAVNAPLRLRAYATSPHMTNSAREMEKSKKEAVKEGGSKDATPSPHKHAPGWKEELATESEAHVKADQSEIGSIEEMQKVTKEHIEKKHD